MILDFDIASDEDNLQALISTETPSLTPPKYLVTIIKIFVKLFDNICPKIGLPAVEDGSPSSFVL